MLTALSTAGERIKLPAPQTAGKTSIEDALARRRSIRDFKSQPVPIQQISQMLWAAQGFTSPDGRRTAPSAGALYPLEIYTIVWSAEGLKPGIYHYIPGFKEHYLEVVSEGDFHAALTTVVRGQECVNRAAMAFVIAGIVERTAVKYGDRARRYVLIEVGHAAQNIHLQAIAIGLGSVPVGAFDDKELQKLLRTDAEPFYVIPIGYPK
ncbi:MAG: SagB/ThcOx family dehydrogenase [Calditrichaeota bacterium]|nr:SagB/ThcOx family dehydrogenase [Calditrichota bacterium]